MPFVILAQNDTCQTVTPNVDFLESIGVTQYIQNYNPKKFNIYLHIVADNSGHARMNDQTINDWLEVLYDDFSPGDISFEVVGKEIIKSDYYYYYSHSKFSQLISENAHNNAIDIYFLNDGTNAAKEASKAKDIPSTTLVIGKGWSGTSVISHEMGHCLGLYHTHEWRFGKDVDGTQCEERGDKVCDTPPDPDLRCNSLSMLNCSECYRVDPDCNYKGIPSGYSPDTRNIMSYTCACCMTHFTNGQIIRMHTTVENYSELQDAYFHIATPQNLSWVNYSGHPKLSWEAVTNPNADSYNIFRNINNCGENCGSYSLIATVNGNTTTFIDNEVNIRTKNAPLYAYYYVTAIIQSYESFPSNTIAVPTNSISKLHLKSSKHDKNIVLGVFPNPFNSSTNIKFILNSNKDIIIKIYNSLGEEIKNIDMGRLDNGIYEYNVNFANYNSGVYYYMILGDNEVIAKGKLINLQ